MDKMIIANMIGVVLLFPFILSSNESITLDVSTYDPKFNWYNTNGSLPLVKDNSVIFNGSNRTNVYQDAISIVSIKANTLQLYANVSFEINTYSNNPKDEFAIFATSNIVTYDKDEFGFVIPEDDNILYAYIQSPDIDGFFIWKPILYLENSKSYTLKAVYSNNDILFYVDDTLVWHTDFVELDDNMHLAIVSHKISDESIDTSKNKMIIYNASLSNL